ncbi:MAG: CAP domain-containing protein, partial [Candidatus Woesearchaeota archaeon]|nr:CAP domain-containing protein [Candidatus Woesearchaeota archaeon]
MKHKFSQHSINVKWSVTWVIIHSISLFMMSLILDYISIQNGFFQLIIFGFGITIFARVVKIFTANKRFIIDKWFIFWSLLNTFTIWLGYLIIQLIRLTNPLGTIVLTAVLLVLISHIIRRFRLSNTKLIVLSIVIIAILLFAINEQSDFNKIISLDFESNENINSGNSNYQDKISDIKETIKINVNEIKGNLDSTSLKNVQKTFNKLNDLRTEKGLSQMEWDNRAYEMAVSRSKDMSDRNYFSHLTPEGQCMQTLKSRYGFGPMETVAENIW